NRRRGVVYVALLAYLKVEQAGHGIVARRHPVGRSREPRTDAATLRTRVAVRHQNRPSLYVHLLRPVLPRETARAQKLPRLTIQHVEECVAIGLHHHLAFPSLP